MNGGHTATPARLAAVGLDLVIAALTRNSMPDAEPS